MFEFLTNNLSSILQKLQGKHTISDDDFNATMREIRLALIEADVALPVAKEFINNIKDKIVGQKTIKGVNSPQLIIKMVHNHLIEILGSTKSELNLSAHPTVIMMIGLQGAGKTTTTAKLALKLKKDKKVLIASLDVYRPAAQKQLEILGKEANIDTLPIIEAQNPIEIVNRALLSAKQNSYDVLILDTAGRLHIDIKMMKELKSIKDLTMPAEILLVADSMTGQDAVNIAKSFNDTLGITGIILTRIDGDARGGAILSMKMTTNCPIKFLANGEKLSDLEDFYPERIANRILNMGDIVSLVEKATEVVGKEEIDKLQQKVQKGNFDFNDLITQLKALNKMGGLASILKFIPNFGGNVKQQIGNAFNDSKITKYIAIINSMTNQERSHPKILNGTRKMRISKGAGVPVHEINLLIKQYNQMNGMIGKFSKTDNTKISQSDLMNLLKYK